MSIFKLFDNNRLWLHEVRLKLLDHNRNDIIQLDSQLHILLNLLLLIQEDL